MPRSKVPKKGVRRVASDASRKGAAARPPTHGATKRSEPLLRVGDVRMIIEDLAAGIAPADVTELISHEATFRERAAAIATPRLADFRAQIDLALDVVRDHVRGECPQIPYRTISLLAAALAYFAERLDVIPDFLPGVGELDDAAVMATACQLARDGLQRYCDWKGRPVVPALTQRALPRR